MSYFRSSLLALALAAPLAGCAATDPNGPTFATTADSAALTTLAFDARQVMYNEASYLGDQFPSFIGFSPRPRSSAEWVRWAAGSVAAFAARNRAPGDHSASPALAAPLATLTFTGCAPLITGEDSTGPIDTDHDGIPDDWKIDWGPNCVTFDSVQNVRMTLAGSTRVQDTGLGFFSYKVTETHSLVRTEWLNDGSKIEGTADGMEEGVFADTGAVRTVHLATTTSQTDSSGTLKSALEVTKADLFHPDSGVFLALGAQLPAGNFSYDADFKIVNAESGLPNAGNYHLVFSTPTLLHHLPACAYAFDSGIFRGLLNGDATIGFDYTWNGCAAPVLTLFGTDQVPATIAGR